MTTFQLKVEDELANKIGERSKRIGISRTSYIKVLIARDLNIGFGEKEEFLKGNIFNAERDNNGKGIASEDFKSMLKNPQEYNWENFS